MGTLGPPGGVVRAGPRRGVTVSSPKGVTKRGRGGAGAVPQEAGAPPPPRAPPMPAPSPASSSLPSRAGRRRRRTEDRRAGAPTPRWLPGLRLPFVCPGGDERKTRVEPAGARTPALLAASRASGSHPRSASCPGPVRKGCGLGSAGARGGGALSGVAGLVRPRGAGVRAVGPHIRTAFVQRCGGGRAGGSRRRRCAQSGCGGGRSPRVPAARCSAELAPGARSVRPTWAGAQRSAPPLGQGD